MNEETGIDPSMVDVSSSFMFQEVYYPTYKRFGGKKVEKSICIYIGRIKLDATVKLNLTEHQSCAWVDYEAPPKPIQKNTIDPLLQKVFEHFKTHPIDDEDTWK
jgi:isopentenyldiphosphate isomerase